MNQTSQLPVLDAALQSLSRGWSVFPISVESKRPLVKWKNYQDELPSETKVRNWFGADYRHIANLGLATGELSGRVVLDVDELEGLEEIERRGGLPHTQTVQTRPDIAHKLHFHFEHPGFEVQNFAKTFKIGDEQIELPGLDFRGDGGYVMLPPSRHHSGAGNYQWLHSPDDAPLAPMPDWLLDLLKRRLEAKETEMPRVQAPVPAIPVSNGDRERKWALSALEGEQKRMLAAGKGGRHEQRRNSAIALGSLVPHLLSEDEAREAISVNFGADKNGAMDTIRDGIAFGRERPRYAPPPRVNPINDYYETHADEYADVGHRNGDSGLPQSNSGRPESQSSQTSNNGGAPAQFDALACFNRLVGDVTREKFQLHKTVASTLQFADFPCYQFPTWTPAGRAGRVRMMSLDRDKTGGEIFHSDEEGPRLPAGYNLKFVCESLQKERADVWVFSDELSVWLAHQAGVLAVSVFSLDGEIRPLIKELFNRGATKLHFCLGTGDAANACALRASYAALKLKLRFTIRALPIPRDGSIVAQLRDRCTSDEAFAKMLPGLPVLSMNKLKELAPDDDSDTGSNARSPKTTKDQHLMDLLERIDGMEVFRTELGETYMSLPRGEHTETHPMPSSKLMAFCRHYYQSETGGVLARSNVENVLGVMQGRALFEGVEREVPTRVGEHGGRIYIDLCNDDWECIEIGEDIPGGWHVIKNGPVAFRRTGGMLPLPAPVRGGKWSEFQDLLGLEGENWVLAVSWMVMALRPGKHPYPVLAVHGEQESGKTTFCKMARRLVDPNFTTLLGTSTRDEEELMLRAKNSFVIGFDNMSNMPNWMNDAICSLVTEGSFAKRSLYSNDEESLFKSMRPVVLNGINENLGRNDFRRRCVKLILPAVTEERKREESDLEEEFQRLWPQIMGLLCDALFTAMVNLPAVELPHRRGLIDFAKWICAAEPALPWLPGQFANAYLVNLQQSIESANDADAFTLTVIDYIDSKNFFQGTIADFRMELNRFADDTFKKDIEWPRSASRFGEKLTRIQPNLRAVGIEMKRMPRRGTGIPIDIRRPVQPGLDLETEAEKI